MEIADLQRGMADLGQVNEKQGRLIADLQLGMAEQERINDPH